MGFSVHSQAVYAIILVHPLDFKGCTEKCMKYFNSFSGLLPLPAH